MCVLNRPDDPHAFVASLLHSKVKARGGEEYDAAMNTDLVRKTYALAAESADENGRVRGSAAFQAEEDDDDDYDDIDFGGGGGSGGKNALSGDVAKRVENLEKVLSSSRRVGGSMEVSSVALSIMEETQHMVGCAKAELYILERATGTMGKCDAETGMLSNQKPVANYGIPGNVSQKGRVLNLPDAYQHADFDASEDQKTGFKTTSMLAVPVPDTKGMPVAVIVASNKMDASKFERSDEEMMVVFAGQIGVSLSHAKENEAINTSKRSQSNMMLVLNELFMNYLSDEKSFVKYMMENGMNVVDCDKCLFYLMDDMNPGQMWSIADDELQYFPVNAGIVGYVATKVETINIVDTSTDPRFDKSHDVRSGYTTKTVLCMPIVDGRGIVVGVVQFLNKIQGVFDQTDEETISQMSNLIGPVVSSLRSAKKDGESKK